MLKPRPEPPVAARRPQQTTVHGVTLTDDYAWLRDPGYPEVTDPEVLAYLEAENSYFEAVMAPQKALTQTIFEELKGRLQRVGEATEGDPERAVRVQAEELLRFAEENRNLVQILFGRDQEAAQIGAHVLRQLALQSEKAWRSRIEAGTARKELDPEVVAQGVLGMLARVVAWWAEKPGRVPREDVLSTLTQLQLYGAYGRKG